MSWPCRRAGSTERGVLSLLVACAFAFLATTPVVHAQEADPDESEGVVLPIPARETPRIPVEDFVGSGERVVLRWPVVEAATEYEVYVNPDTEAARPTWFPVDGFVEEDVDEEAVMFVDRNPPEPVEDRETISYAVLALNDEGEIVAEGRVAVEPEGPEAPFPPRGDDEQEVTAATTTGFLVGVIALAVIAIGALAYIGIRRGRK